MSIDDLLFALEDFDKLAYLGDVTIPGANVKVIQVAPALSATLFA